MLRSIVSSIFAAVAVLLLSTMLEPAAQTAVRTTWLYLQPVPTVLPVPVDRVSPRKLADSWHAARSGGRRHEGIDIFASRGTPVRSTTRGIIARVGHNTLGGNFVWVIGPAGHRHYYAHLARFGDVHAGRFVLPGDVLGYVGNSGNAAGGPAHLHYGIYTSAGPINPYPLLRGVGMPFAAS
ncbi:M23 family metallopeptidase [Propionivibrio soli]|uniref:M23 family metallopeptidase n=1 Tax=Propionivibrio soli TaxID=2976531 RepID=UPI0021E8A6E1|nr:M23 family metallopeptidase [Propionivibrio soli]